MISEAVLSVLALVAELIREFGSFLVIVTVTVALPSLLREAREPCPHSGVYRDPIEEFPRDSREPGGRSNFRLVVTIFGMGAQ